MYVRISLIICVHGHAYSCVVCGVLACSSINTFKACMHVCEGALARRPIFARSLFET